MGTRTTIQVQDISYKHKMRTICRVHVVVNAAQGKTVWHPKIDPKIVAEQGIDPMPDCLALSSMDRYMHPAYTSVDYFCKKRLQMPAHNARTWQH